MKLFDWQSEIVDKALGQPFFLNGSDMGCLAGNTLISINRGGKGWSLPISVLVDKFNVLVDKFNGSRSETYMGRAWNLDIPTHVQRAEGDHIRLAKLKAAWWSGVKTTFTIQTEAGRVIRATHQHPFLTPRGWKCLEELAVGDEVLVRGDRDVSNNALSNLSVLTHREHNALHGKQHAWSNVALPVTVERIESITFYGQEDTYDIEVENDPHNFIANGFVVHNTGKTVMALEEIRRAREVADPQHPSEDLSILVVCPRTLKSVWTDHIARMFPYSPCVEVPAKTTSAQQQAALDSYFDTDWPTGFLIVHWDVVGNRFVDAETGKPLSKERGGIEQPLIGELRDHHWHYIIADEAHKLRNRHNLRRRGFRRIKGDHKRALTGTLIVNRPDEAWGILNWLDPKTYSSYWRFFDEHVAFTLDAYGYRHVVGPRDADAFRAEIDPFFARAPKSLVTTQEPLRTDVVVEMAPQQRRAYNEMSKEMLAWIGSEPDTEPLPAPSALARLVRLGQFSNAYAEYDHDTGKVRLAEPSPKLDALMEILEGTDEPIVVFTRYRQMLELAIRRFEASEPRISYVQMHGDSSDDERAAAVESFQGGGAQVFIATMQTASEGITLTAAQTMIFLDRSWSPADNYQAESRSYGRLNDAHGLNVITISSARSIDQRVEATLELKRSWLRKMLGEDR